MFLSDLQQEQAYRVIDLAETLLELFEAGRWAEALEIWSCCDLDADERVVTWGFLDSRQRAWLKGEDRKYLEDFREWR